MDKFNININRLKRQVFSNIKVVRLVIVCLISVLLLSIEIVVFVGVRNSLIGTYISAGKDFLFPNSNKIILHDNRVNVLILGKGDLSHDAPELTDTMIVASISTQTKNISLISIPRDIWVEDFRDKINAAYMRGNDKQSNGGGLTLAKSSVEEVLGIEIPYAVTFDFNGFKEIIDAVGGVEVDVKNNFTDNQFPIKGKENDECGEDKTFKCRYISVTFEKGMQTMDGERALIFVRSRHGDNNEGNDIARQARQQLLMTSLFGKLTKPETFLNISTDRKLVNVLERNVEIDMKTNEIAIVARYGFDARGSIKSSTIPETLLLNPPNQYLYFNEKFDHAFVFIPNNEDKDWRDVHTFVKSLLN